MAGNRQQFTLQFNADTTQAKKALQDLNNSLNAMMKLQHFDSGLHQDITEAADAARVLQQELQKAINVNTGKLNVSDFARGIAEAGTSLNELSGKLLNAGQTGQVAFNSLAKSIISAEVPIKRMNATLSNALTTLKNTVKWEISSTFVHGLESAFSGAVSYAKNLNTSLTNIRIVTGQSVDDMARFAVQANKAAKELSTTTKAYADASLIYYQQGDSAEQAAKKAAITIKAANASFGTSAAEMSEYLTSVWNSYQVGADELERYVDIMAALGAKTATSLEEIATSMQKVAATSNTVGVSMEQVSSIIATVSSVTRESAESIGTSYKTIFARIGDLKLGETLDDGVTLGQVSSQLDKIGVQILDANGEMRDMGAIIEDLGAKWQTMSRAEQTAIAQVVAGKRQYTQLMALFENWDMYEKNMTIASDADGELQQMANIYAESWEAASARVTASLESIYNKLINDQAIIKMTNSLASLIKGIESVIDGLGGMPGVLATVGNTFVTLFRNKIAGSINGAIDNIINWGKSFKGMSGFQGIASVLKGESSAIREYQRLLKDLRTKSVDSAGAADSAKEETNWTNTTKIIEAKQRLLTIENSLSEAQKQAYQSLINDAANSLNSIQNLTNEYNEQKTSLDQLTQSFATLTVQKEAYEKATGKTNTDLVKSNTNMTTLIQQKWGESIKKFEYGQGKVVTNKNMGQIFNAQLGMGGPQLFAKDAEIQKTSASLEQLIQRFRALSQAAQGFSANASGFKDVLDNLKADNLSTSLERLDILFDALKASLQGTGIDVSWLDKLQQELHESTGDAETFKTKLQSALTQINAASNTAGASAGQAFSILAQKLGVSDQKLTEIAEQAGLSAEQLRRLAVAAGLVNGNISKLGNGLKKGFGDTLAKIANGASSALASFSAMSSAIENWDDSTLASKVTSIGNTIASIGTQLASGNWIGAAMSAIGAGIGYLIGKIEAEKKRLEKILEFQNIRNTKNIEDDTTELKNLSSLMKEYSSLYETYQQTGEGQDKLSESANKLAEAYGLTGAAIAAITGNFSEFNKEVQQTLSFTQKLANSESVYTKAQNTLLVTGTQKNYGLTSGSAFSSQDMIATSLDSYYREQAQQYYDDFLVPNKEMSFVGADAEFTRTLYKNVIMPDAIDKNGAWTHSGQLAVDVLVDKLWKLGLNKDKEAQAMMEQAFGSKWKEETGGGIYHPNISTDGRTWDQVYDVLWKVADKVVTKNEYEKISLNDIGVSTEGLVYSLKGAWQGNANKHERYMNTLIDEGYITEQSNPQLIATLAMRDSMYGENNEFAHLFNEAKTGLEWDPTTADEVVQQFKDYQDYYDHLTSIMTQLDPDSELYKTAVKIQTELNKVLQDETLKTSIDNYTQAKNNYAQWQLVDTTLKTTIGANEHDGEMSLNDYLQMEKTLTEQVEQNRNLFDSLAIFGDFKLLSEAEQAKLSPEELTKYQQTTEEYLNARQKIVDGLFDDYTSLDEYTNMAQALSDAFGKDSHAYKQMANYIDANKITTMSGTMLSAAQAIFAMNPNADLSSGTDQAFLNRLMEDEAKTSYSLTYDQMTAAKGSLKQDMSFEDASILYETFFEGQENAAQEWTNFVAKSFEEKEKYIDQLIANAKTADQTSIEDARDAFKEQRDAWASLMKETYGESIVNALINNKDFEAANSAFNEYINTLYNAQTDDAGNIIGYTVKEGQTDALGLNTALSSGDLNSAFTLFTKNYGNGMWKDLANLAPLSDEGMSGLMQAFSVYSTLNSQYLEQDTLWNILSGVGASPETQESLTASEKQLMQMERAQKQVDALTNAVSEFQSTGKLSKSTKNALELLGINADDIDTMDELIGKITELQQKTKLDQWDDVAAASGLDQIQLKEIFQDNGTIKGFDELGESSTITQEQYNAAIQAYEMKLAILGIDTEELKLQYQQAEATKAVNEAIELQKQTVEKSKEEAVKMTAAYNALSNSIGESALSFEAITKATQAGLDVSNWSSDVTKQLDIISQAAYKAYEAEKAVLEAQKLNFDESKMDYTNGKIDQIWDKTSLVQKVNKIMKDGLDAGDLDLFINDYFSQFNGATQEAVRSYISSLKEAGKSFTWEGLIGYLDAENLMTQNEIDLLRANLKDGLTGMLDEAIAEHQEAAQEVANAWVTAFDAIMKAKEGLADGKSIAESLIGDQEGQTALLAKYLTNNPNASKQDAMNWLHNQNLSQTSAELTPEKWSSKDWSNARGMFSVANRYGDNSYAQSQDEWEQWVKDRFKQEWNSMDSDSRKEIEDNGGTFNSYLEEKWAEFLDGRTKEQAYNSEVAAMIVAESDANQQYIESQIKTAQTVYQNTVESAQTQQGAWQQVYDAQQQVLSDTTGELTLTEALGENLNTVLAEINKGRDENNQLTVADLERMSLDQIATEINAQSATINAAQVTLQEGLSNRDINGDGKISGTPIKDSSGKIVDASNNKTAQEAVEAAQENTNAAKDAEITTGIGGQAFADTWDSVAASVGMAKDEFKELAQYLYETAGNSGNLDAASENLQDTYRRLAKEVVDIQNAWDDLTKSQADNIKMIKNQEKANAKYPAGLKNVTKDIKKIFGDSEKVTENFVEEHIDLIEKMVQGDLEAAEKLEGELLKDILGDDKFNEPIKVDFDVDHDGVVDQLSTVGELLNNFGDEFANKPVGFTVDVDDSAALASLSNMATNGTLSADQIQAAFDAIGWAPEVEVDDYTLTEQDIGRGYINVPSVDPITGKVSYEQHSIDSSYQAGQTISIPRIGKATKKGGGASSNPYKNNNGKGGGGGGGGKPKKIDKKKPEDEKERYHETEQTLERLADELEKVDKFKSRAYGKGHLDAIKQEINLLKQEINVQADYLKQAKEYLAMDRNRVASLGATFNADGTISNYDELMDSIIAKYNAFVDKYNSSSAKQQENMEEEKEQMDEWFDEAMEWISQYEETLNLTRDKENEILELQNEISAKALEGIQYKIEFEVELNEEETDFLDYLNEKYGEVLEKQDILVENLVRQQQLAQENLAILDNAKAELDAKYASGELSQADYVSGLQDINDQILENLSTLEDLRKEIQEAYGNALELATEAINNHTEKMEHASSMMQSYISIMGLIGQGVDYQKLSEFYEKQYEYNLNSLKTQQDYLDVLKEEQAYYLAKMAAGELTETERKQFEDLQDTIAEVEEGILSKTEETLTALREAFALTVEGILKGFEESIAGAGNSLEDLAADYEYYLEVQERNVSASKELYEISKLNRQIEQDIADTSSSVYKQRLAALQEEIKAKSADRALTEYDIQMMNLEYELLQRQMALEEAKNAKDTVRLTRDSSGNMVYQYTANQDQIAEAQQGVEDVLQRMAEANAERVTQLEQETINTYQDMVSQIEEIANSEVLTQEEKNAKIAEIVARTQEKMGWIQDQYIIATENTASTYERIQDQYGANMADAAQMTKDSMNGTIGEIIAKTNEFATTMSQVQTDVANELALLYQNMDTVLTTTKWDQAAESIENYDLVIEDAEQDAQKMIDTLGGEDGLLDKIKDTTAAWDAQSVAINALIEYYEKLYQSILKIQQTESTKTPPLPSTPSTTPSTETKTEEKTPTTTEPEDEEANANQVQYQGGSWQFYTYDAASGGKRGAVFHGNNKSPVVTKEDESANRIKISGMDGDGHSFSGSWISKVYKNKELWKAYETGGLVDYTGPAWVDGTKNRPELMLNASDTENMLAAVQTVRSLDTATLTLLDDFIKLATSSMLSANSLHATGVHHTDQELQQQVHITAEFPNVQDSNEIQDAFDNLINRAAQFVGSIKK